MTTETTPAAEDLVPDTRGSDFTVPDYTIAADDRALADEIAGFDPVFDTKGPTNVSPTAKLPTSIKASGLPPHLRGPILAQLGKVPVDRREAEEARLVNEALYQNAYQTRVACGPGDKSNAYQREFFALEFERHEVAKELDRIGTLLGEVDPNARVVTDEAGQQRVETQPRIRGQQRVALEAAFAASLHHHAQLHGLEAERRMAKALSAAVADVKALRSKVAEQSEGKALGEEMAREQRVRRIAEAHAKRASVAV